MNLTDPFGRMESRRQKEYESLSSTLREAGVDTKEQAEELIVDARRRRKKSIIIAAVITLILAVVFPEGRLFIIPLGTLFCFWVLKITGNGEIYIRRYIDEELSDNSSGEDAGI